MLRRMPACGLAVVACCAAVWAQGVEGPTFEVASIKPPAPSAPGQFVMGMRGGPGSNGDPGQITATNVALRDLLATAYNVKRYQISGPDWIDSQRFDIIAKVPAGSTKEQAQVMWQNLLKERFGLKVHHETKDMPLYALVVGKNGPKLTESVADPPKADSPDPAQAPRPDGVVLPRMAMGKDGMPQLPASMRRPGSMMMMMINGRIRMMGTGITMSALTENLGRQFDRPVTDQTGLTKHYDVTLDFLPENMGGMKGMPMPPPGGMGGPPPGGGGAGEGGPMMRGPDAPSGAEPPTLAVALQEQLGLKLEAKKGPVDLLVIDHLEKMPTEN